jgi:hypothetical protein
MEKEEEGIIETIKKGIIDKGYNIEEDIEADSSRHIMFTGNGKNYVLNLLRLE